jgi:putative ABC transport system ATP-binding protein
MTSVRSAPDATRAEGDGVAAIALSAVRFAYPRGASVLDIPSLDVARGERLFVFGPSGSGKTTLLGLLAGVLRASAGAVHVLGRDLSTLSSAERDAHRAAHVGYIFQLFNLIPYLSVFDNIALPARVSRERASRVGRDLDHAVGTLAKRLDIEGLLRAPVTELSVGQQQRVAAARALLGGPELVVADEPTSALDADRRRDFLELLFECCASAGSTLVFVSHDRQLEALFDRGVSLPDINRAGRR